MSGWYLIEDRTPVQGQRIVIVRGDGLPFAGEYCGTPGYGRCIDRATGVFHCGFELWMPLPANDSAAQPSAEPAQYQFRFKHPATDDSQWSRWTECTAEQHDRFNREADDSIAYEVRKLYTHPPTDSAALRDAERYRWLRDEAQSSWSGERGPVLVHATPWTHTRWREELDAAIDAAMAEHGEQSDG